MSLIRKYLVPLAYLSMLTVNILANALPLNNQTTGEISSRFEIFFVPAGYVFAIWFVIYVLTGWYSVYQLRNGLDNKRLDTVGIYFIIGSLANILWLTLWHFDLPALSTIPMVVLFVSLIGAFIQSKHVIQENELNAFALHTPFAVYLGWISVALTANISILLYVIGWDGWGISGPVWVAFLTFVIGIISLIMLIKEKSIAYVLVIVWALTGIYVKFPSESAIALSTIPMSILLILSSVVVWARSRQRE